MTTHDLQDRLSDLEAENTKLKSDLERLEQYLLTGKGATALQAELQSLKAQNAAMREALEPFTKGVLYRDHESELYDAVKAAKAALSTTQPSSPRSLGATYHGPYVSREAVLPVAQAVEFLLGECDRKTWTNSKDDWCPVPKALAVIRELGLLEPTGK